MRTTAKRTNFSAELKTLIEAHCPQLLAEHGCGPVTAAIIHTAGAKRFPTDACFARHTGTAPIPASSGNTKRHRLHRGGDRQLNHAIHIIALSRARTDPPPAPTSTADTLKARPRKKRSAASSATSPATCGGCCTRPKPHHQHRPNPNDPAAPTLEITRQRHPQSRPVSHAMRPLKPANSDTPLT